MPRIGFNTAISSELNVGVRQSDLRIAICAFNKHIATELTSRLAGARTLLDGSDEQKAIWDVALNQEANIIVAAVAGSGKTTTALQYCYRAGGTVAAMTYHSLGFRAVKKAVRGRCDVDQYKVDGIIDGMTLPCAQGQEFVVKGKLKKLVSLAKQYGFKDRKGLEWIVDAHDLDMNGHEELVLDYTPKVLDKCAKQTSTVDFDDMVWLPCELQLDMPQYDLVITDEAQDLNVIQQWCALRSADRHIVVGDPKQSCYSFRGADSKSMERMKAELGKSKRGVVELPLNFTRRCPTSHVLLAQTIVPNIKAMPDATKGVVRHETYEKALGQMKVGDLVLCRVNADLLSCAYQLIRRGTKAVIRGRDIGQGIVQLIAKCEKKGKGVLPVLRMLELAWEIIGREIQKYNLMPNGRGAMRSQAAQDKYDCLCEVAGDAKDSTEVKKRVESLFSDFEADGTPKNAVILGTIHRTKGLESNRVWILRPELIPHPMARREEEKAQEYHIAYIAVTRSKAELVFVEKQCPLFPMEA